MNQHAQLFRTQNRGLLFFPFPVFTNPLHNGLYLLFRVNYPADPGTWRGTRGTTYAVSVES